MVCAANMNLSMEAHRVLLERGIDVKSYGAGNHVKLPGASRDNPNVFSFGVESYQQIYDALMERREKESPRGDSATRDVCETFAKNASFSRGDGVEELRRLLETL